SLAFSSNSKGQIVGNSLPCTDDVTVRPFLWENGGPMVDLNSLIPPDSGLLLREGTFINDGGEIAGRAQEPNGDEHVFLLIPRDDEDDEEEAAGPTAVAAQRNASVAAASPAKTNHRRLTPEKLAELRARFASSGRGLGFRPAKPANRN